MIVILRDHQLVWSYPPVGVGVGVSVGVGVGVGDVTVKEFLLTEKSPNFPLSIACFNVAVAVAGSMTPRKNIVKSTTTLPSLQKKEFVWGTYNDNRYSHNLLEKYNYKHKYQEHVTKHNITVDFKKFLKYEHKVLYLKLFMRIPISVEFPLPSVCNN